MFTVVSFSGPIFYLDWSGRLVEIQQNDTLTDKDNITSLNPQTILLRCASGIISTLPTAEPKSVEDLLDQYQATASEISIPQVQSSPSLGFEPQLLENEFKGSVIEDNGIGACGKIKLNGALQLANTKLLGTYGNLEISNEGDWLYLLLDDVMAGGAIPKDQFAHDLFSIVMNTEDSEITYELEILLQGTEDIPDINNAKLVLPKKQMEADTNGSERNQDEPESALLIDDAPAKVIAERELMSMIDALLVSK